MAFLFKRNPKTPSELVRVLNDQVTKLDNTNDLKKVQDDTSRYLSQITVILHGDEENVPQPDQISQLAQEVYSTDCLYLLIANLHNLEFNSRKDVSILFTTLLRREIGNRNPTVDHLLSKPKILITLLRGPENSETCLITGAMLRDCIKYEAITKYLLKEPLIWQYFNYSKNGTFENATDAFITLSDLLTVHKKAVAEFFNKNLEKFIFHINNLINLGNYVTKRQAVKLLSQLIMQRSNYHLLQAYVDSPQNLKLIMILLSDKSKNLQIEAFNVFKIFIANPKKSKPILDILIKNRDKLITYLRNFSTDRKENMREFNDEKEFVIQQIEDLPRLIVSNSNSSVDIPNLPNHARQQQQQQQQQQ
ncbi:hypothetical protein PACTADRAFT_48195 [Pachysolen tannophilus NRRL Y-2460]|uniref:Mo25-like protein n=1 Tax=Pachysolen tannophilus NRRL Y-2460 TaxID=669874 RepID=A0A1E4U348_PACTA|nr:hypothetical protein PACTADRAFT_48195 [Pachysolen tannophilus NRRL Y-2460]